MNRQSRTIAFWLRPAAGAAICAVCVFLGSCAFPAAVTTGSSTGQPTSSPTVVGSIHVTDDQDGGNFTLHPGETLTVVLSLTTWTFQGSSDPRVLAQVGSPVVSPTPFNKTTCPYGGCGTVTAVFRAVASGTANVLATRDSCGEAMGCTGDAARYQITVMVTAAP